MTITSATTEPSRVPLRVRLLRQAAQYSLGTFLAMLASVARGGVGAKYLPTAQMGIWLGLQVLLGYVANLHFGVIYGMFRTVPMKLAQGDKDAVNEELRTSFTVVSIASALLVGTGLVGGSRLLPTARFDHIVLAVGLALVTLLRTWYVTLFKAQRRFSELSLATGLSSTCGILGVLAIPPFGLVGLLAGMLAQYVVELAILVARTRLPGFGIVRSTLVEQVRIGMPTVLASLGAFAITTFDRTVMLRMLGATATGFFSIGAQLALLVPILASVPMSVLTPVFFERFARREDLLPLVDKPIRLLSYAFSWVIAVLTIAIAPMTALIWPHLAAGVLACKLALLGTLPIMLVGPISNIYYAADRQILQLVVLGISAAVTFALACLGVRLTDTIAGAAGGAALGSYIYYFVSVVGAFHVVKIRKLASITFSVRSVLPLVYAISAVAVSDLALRGVGTETSLVRACIAELVVTAAMAPWLWKALRLLRTGK